MSSIELKDKLFVPYITNEKISDSIITMARKMNLDLSNENPFFIVILNGAFMFAADLIKEINIPCETAFVKLASYEGTKSLGVVSELIGLNEDVSGRTVVILDDIIDTGNTLACIVELISKKGAKQIKVATLLFKKDAYKKNIAIDYVGINIPDKFVVGYGMDYNGSGRNLKDIYTTID